MKKECLPEIYCFVEGRLIVTPSCNIRGKRVAVGAMITRLSRDLLDRESDFDRYLRKSVYFARRASESPSAVPPDNHWGYFQHTPVTSLVEVV